MNNYKKIAKEYHVIGYICLSIIFFLTAYLVKWYAYNAVVASYGEKAVTLYKWYNNIIVILFLGGTFIFYITWIKTFAIEKIFLGICLITGLIFMIVIPPNGAADEDKHMFKVNDFVNMVTGVGQAEEDTIYLIRESDANSEYDRSISASSYINYSENFFQIHASNKIEEVVSTEAYDYNNSTILFYFPAVIGLFFARILGLGTALTYLLARSMMLLVYAFLGYFSIKKLPVGKLTLALILLMPMSIQRAACISQDAVIHGMVFLFLSYVIYYMVEKQKIVWKDAIILGIAGVFVIVAKGGVLLPLLLILFMIPKEAFGKRSRYKYVVIGSMLGTILVYMFSNYDTVLDLLISSKGVEHELSWVEEQGYTLSILLHNPKNTLQILVNTLYFNGATYFQEMICGGVGWLQINISYLLVVAYCALFGISIINADEKKTYFTKKQKNYTLIFVLFSMGLTMLSMWIFWTPISSRVISGLQGRYFIPFLLPILIAIKNKKIILNIDLSSKVLFVSYIITVCVFFNIWLNISI